MTEDEFLRMKLHDLIVKIHGEVGGGSRFDDSKADLTCDYALLMISPILKWAGGKRKLAPTILDHIRPYHERARLQEKHLVLCEPFVGGAAVSLAALDAGFVQPRSLFWNDLNPAVLPWTSSSSGTSLSTRRQSRAFDATIAPRPWKKPPLSRASRRPRS